MPLNNSPNKEKRKRDVDEVENEYDLEMEGYSGHSSEVRSERRATIVCEKHRRWKVTFLYFRALKAILICFLIIEAMPCGLQGQTRGSTMRHTNCCRVR